MAPEQATQLIEAAKRMVITKEHVQRFCERLDAKEKELEEKDNSFDMQEFLNRTYKI